MTLTATEFIRCFLLHTLPDGFHRIRHYGFLANAQRAAKLARCRALLDAPPQVAATPPAEHMLPGSDTSCFEVCPACAGPMLIIGQLPRAGAPLRCDTS